MKVLALALPGGMTFVLLLGVNSVQSYRIEGDHADDFDVDFSSIDIPYLIVRSPLDRQRISSYSLTLIASDQSRSGSMQLDIRVTNGSIPTFLQSVYTVDVREDASIGTTLLRVEATSDNERTIFYEIVNESPFMIDRLTGQIQVKQLLDYEREKSYRLTIKAYENSIPTNAIVFIRVTDVNDNAVDIQIRVQGFGKATLKQTVLSIPEDTPPGTPIVSKNRCFIENYTLFTMKRCFHRWKRILTKIHQWSFVKSDTFHAFSLILQKHSWMSMISSVPHRFSPMFSLHQCSPVISAHSSHVLISWCDNIDDHRWLSGYITRENQCHQNLQDHPWYPLFVMHDLWLFDVINLQRKLDSCSCGSTSFYWYPRASTRQFYKTFPTHLSRRRVRGWQWPQ